MRLIRCHIENFGKLHDYSVDFAHGANIICEENGWGKSTFAAFVRAMFYGLDGERKHSIEENEVKRYTPWQGGVFGGSLTFEVDGKQYTVTRTFGKTNDFELRDAKTNLISNDFTSKLGEEIFKVNRESFMRTVFIGQADCGTSSTDDINAKIGALTDNSDDLSNFETANKKLTDIINSLNPRRVTGSISKRKNEITEFERKVTAGNGIPEAIIKIQEKIEEKTLEYNRVKAEIDAVREEQTRVSKMQSAIAKKEQWESLKNTCKIRNEEMQAVKKNFPKEIPHIAIVEEKQGNCNAMEKASERVSTYAMTEMENAELSELQMVFEKETPTETTINEMLRSVQKLSGLRKTLLIEELTQQKAKKNPIMLIIGLILAVVGVILSVANPMIPGIIVIIAGVALVIVGTLMNKSKSPAESEKEERIEAEQLQESVNKFLLSFGYCSDEERFINDLHELNHKITRYTYLKEKKQNLQKASVDYKKNKNEILDFFVNYGFEPTHNLQTQLVKIRDDIQDYNEAKRLYDEVAGQLEAFEKETDMAVLTTNVPEGEIPSLTELNQKLSGLADVREACYQEIEGYNNDLEDLQEQYDEWEENKLHLEETRKIQDEEQRKYDYVVKAQKYLGLAKESLTARYTAPIFNSFTKYYEIITNSSSDQLRIDANTNITVVEQGKQRETNTLSLGYRDLIGVCLRVALVDAMYTDEAPVLIMDDPFTNLDDKKMEAAKEFLKQVSEKYQIIYFTCSDARK